MEVLDAKLEEYYGIDKMIKRLEGRKAQLNKVIKRLMLDTERLYYTNGSHEALLQIKRHKINYDEGAMAQLLADKGLWECSQKVVVDPDAVKQLYIEGDLTDDDLRGILAIPKDPNVALKVEPCTKE